MKPRLPRHEKVNGHPVICFHPEYHPDNIGKVAIEGWRCVMECSMDGLSARAEVCLGLGKDSVESIARDLSMHSWLAKFESDQKPL